MVDHEGVILEINDAFESAYGWSSALLKGKMLTEIIPGDLRDAHHMGFSRFLMTEEATILEQALELNILTSDGQMIPAMHFIAASREGGEWFFAALIRKIEET